MKTQLVILMAIALFAVNHVSGQDTDKIVSKQTHIKFFSSTPAEDIEANNYASVSTLDPQTGEGVFSVPMQSFEFEKALMQKHFNSSKFLDTKSFPKAKLKAKVVDIEGVDFEKDGTYEVNVEGDLTIKGTSNPIKEKATIKVEGEKVTVNSTFNITLSDYGIEFVKGKPSTNVAKEIEVTVIAIY